MPVNHDTFTDVNGILIEDHTPDQGGDWIWLGTGAHTTGLIVQDNQLTNPTGLTTEYVVDSGRADCIILTTLYKGLDLAISGVIFRSLQSTNSDDHFLLNVAFNHIELIRYSSGPEGSWVETNNVLGNNVFQTREVKIILKGNSIKVYVDDTSLFDRTDSVLSTGVFHGFRVDHGASIFYDSWLDDFGVFDCDATWLGINPDQSCGYMEIDP